MKIAFLTIGRIKKDYIRQGIEDYTVRIKKYFPFEAISVKEERGGHIPIEDVLKREGRRIIEKLKRDDFVIVLSDKGKGFSTVPFSRYLERIFSGGKKRVCFVVGGAFGLSYEVIEKADLVLALSSMTLPHELALLVLSEQCYRALTIINKEPYSH